MLNKPNENTINDLTIMQYFRCNTHFVFTLVWLVFFFIENFSRDRELNAEAI